MSRGESRDVGFGLEPLAGDELVTLKTRVRRSTADALSQLAAAEDRSLAAELRQAIDRHLEARKDAQ